VHLREEKMYPWEIMLSESQERMVYVVDPCGIDKVMEIAHKYDIPAAVIGETTDSGLFKLFWDAQEIASVPPASLCDGPMYVLNEEEPSYIKEFQEKKLDAQIPLEEAIKTLISDPNFASKRWVYSQYDHTVGNRTSIKPGQAGAAGIWLNEENGILGLTIDSNGRQVFLDPYNGAINTVWEAYRNLVSSGFEPVGVTNCLNFGNPEKDEVSYQFVNTINGMATACTGANIPIVSGNVSFYNESPNERVYPTPAIGMIGYTEDYKNLIKNSFKKEETVFLIGNQIDDTSDVAGSLYHMAVYDFLGGKVDKVDVELEKKLKKTIFELREEKLLGGCIDLSEGGLFGALFEGIKLGNVGFKGSLIDCNDQQKCLLGEATGRYLISAEMPEKVKTLLTAENIPFKELGITTNKSTIEFDGYKFNTDELFALYDSVIEHEMNNET
jgi:phosphoribosylformylglycinamidine synthase